MKIEISQINGGVIETVNGFPVRQHFNVKTGRWYVWLPKHSGLRELYKKPDRMLRSHYVYCRYTGLSGISKSFVVHHIDRDRTNDQFLNLELMSIADHNRLHENDKLGGNFLGRRHHPETIDKMKKIAQKRGNNGVWNDAKTSHSEATKELMSKKATGRKNAMYRHDLEEEAIIRCYEKIKNIGQVAMIFGCSRVAVRWRIRKSNTVTNDWKQMSEKELLQSLKQCGTVSSLALKLNAPLTSLWRKIKEAQKNV